MLKQTSAIVTHDPMVAEYTRRVITLRDGKIASDISGTEKDLVCESTDEPV